MQGNKEDPHNNAEGYSDPTAYNATRDVQSTQAPQAQQVDHDRELKKLIATLYSVCDFAGYQIVDRIVLRERKTGKIWR